MKLLTLSLTLLLPFICAADTLLIPDQTVSQTRYLTKCHAVGYQCTTKYFADHELASITPRLDAFFDSVDLTNKEFVDTAQKKIQLIIQDEMISISQLDMILRLFEQMNAQSLGKSGRLVEEIKFIRQSLPNDSKAAYDESEVETVIYFKTTLPKSKFLKLKQSYLSLPYTVITFNHAPIHTTTKEKLAAGSPALVTGVCEKAQLNNEIEGMPWNVMSEASCGWTQSLAQNTSSVMTTVIENKGWLLVGALTIGALVLANKYDISFQF